MSNIVEFDFCDFEFLIGITRKIRNKQENKDSTGTMIKQPSFRDFIVKVIRKL